MIRLAWTRDAHGYTAAVGGHTYAVVRSRTIGWDVHRDGVWSYSHRLLQDAKATAGILAGNDAKETSGRA